ncbi:hypothetical protein HHI36_002062, partial [Cryptolaemus montrouzieri]
MDFVSIDGKQYTGEVHQLFSDREEDGDISDTSTINSDHDSEEEYSIGGDVTVETEPDPNDGFDGDAEGAATNSVPGNFSDLPSSSANCVYGKNRCKWSKQGPVLCRTRSHYIILHLPGLKTAAGNLQIENPLDYWCLLITDEIISIIVDCTNEKKQSYQVNMEKPSHIVITSIRLKSKHFFGLLNLTSIFKSNNEDAADLFTSDGIGRDIFRATMSLKRFLFFFDSIA